MRQFLSDRLCHAPSVFVLFSLCFGLLFNACLVGGNSSCGKDTDCKGKRICLYGQCVELKKRNDSGEHTERNKCSKDCKITPELKPEPGKYEKSGKEPRPGTNEKHQKEPPSGTNEKNNKEPLVTDKQNDAGSQKEPFPKEMNDIPDLQQREQSPSCTDGESRSCYTGNSITKNRGACKDGIQICSNGVWEVSCQGEILPSVESCNRSDDDCDGKVDNRAKSIEPLIQNCYSGPNGTAKKGECKEGKKICLNGTWSPCGGEVKPSKEVCDGKDNDCDGQIDNPPGTSCTSASKEVLIKAGSFQMGSPSSELGHDANEGTHKVTLTNSFYIYRHEMTQKEFKALMGYNPSLFTGCGAQCPVDQVNWHEAAAACNALSKAANLSTCFTCTGSQKQTRCEAKRYYVGSRYYNCKGYRLPTEAEWEYAYRAGTQTAFYNGGITSKSAKDPNLEKIAWYYSGMTKGTTHSIGLKTPNKWGLYDMSGNVWEWVYGGYGPYPTGSVSNPVGTIKTLYITRGGSFNSDAKDCRAASRKGYDPLNRFGTYGFRPVRTR